MGTCVDLEGVLPHFGSSPKIFKKKKEKKREEKKEKKRLEK